MAKTVKTRIVNKHDIEANWIKAVNFVPLKGELIIYDTEVDENGKTLDLPSGRTTPYTFERFKIGDGVLQADGTVKGTTVTNLPFAGSDGTLGSGSAGAADETVILKTDLYTYTNIGKITGASNTSPKIVAEAGRTLKDVFDAVFGTQQDQQPTITTSNVSLGVSAGTTSYGGGEYGTSVAATDVTITFTLNNSATAQYGYRCGDTKTTTSNAAFKYAITKQSNADMKIILPSDKTATSSMVTAGTCVSTSSNVLYCNFNSSNQVSIKISLAAGSVTTSQQPRYGQIKGEVTLGGAVTTSGTAITKFLTYLKNDATETAKLSGGLKSNTAGAYTISAGSYSPYYLASTASTLTSVAKNAATKYTSGSAVSITCATDSYIWFLLIPGTTGSKTIQYEALGQWYEFTGGTTGPTDVTLTLDSGATATYKAYRTNKQAAAGTTQFKIV